MTVRANESPATDPAMPAPDAMSAHPQPPSADRRRRGRPALMTREQVLAAIQALSMRPGGLFRVHDTHSDLYARARRMFGTWSQAVAGAGADYAGALELARRRSIEARRGRPRGRRDA